MFPYHAKTNKVGLVSDSSAENSANSNEADIFPRHSENQGGNTNFNDMNMREIFTVRHRVENKYIASSDDKIDDEINRKENNTINEENEDNRVNKEERKS